MEEQAILRIKKSNKNRKFKVRNLLFSRIKILQWISRFLVKNDENIEIISWRKKWVVFSFEMNFNSKQEFSLKQKRFLLDCFKNMTPRRSLGTMKLDGALGTQISVFKFRRSNKYDFHLLRVDFHSLVIREFPLVERPIFSAYYALLRTDSQSKKRDLLDSSPKAWS